MPMAQGSMLPPDTPHREPVFVDGHRPPVARQKLSKRRVRKRGASRQDRKNQRSYR